MAVQAFLDGVDVTQYVQEGSVTKRLNRPGQASIKVPGGYVSGGDTSRLKIAVDGGLDFHGSVEYFEHEGDENERWTTFTALDPTHIFQARYARDADGDYTKPTFIEDFVTGPAIMQEILQNAITAAGPMGVSLGSFAGGGADLSGAPTNFPMYVSEVQTLLTETGECDVVCSPIDSGGNMGSVSAYPGDYGANLSGSVSFLYATGGNCRRCRVTSDKQWLRNRIRYLLGPRRMTAADPGGDQHWDGSIDRTTVAQLPNPPQAQIESARAASEIAHYAREELRIVDAQGNSSVLPRQLYLRLWQADAWIKLKAKTMVHITPHRGIPPSFDVGDRIAVNAPVFGISGTQRVMERTYRWTQDGPIELGEPVGQAGAHAISATNITEGL